MWDYDDPEHPFSNYEYGQIVKNEKNEWVMKKSSDVLYKVTGYGTSNAVFTRNVYSNPYDPLPQTIVGRGDRSIYSSPMNAEEILDFTLTLTTHFIALSNRSLQDICYSKIAKNITFFNTQILPNEIKDKLQKVVSTSSKTI